MRCRARTASCGWMRIVPNEHCLPMFYEVAKNAENPEHVHGPQWGVVLQGEMEMPYCGIDVFADAHRYEALADGASPARHTL